MNSFHRNKLLIKELSPFTPVISSLVFKLMFLFEKTIYHYGHTRRGFWVALFTLVMHLSGLVQDIDQGASPLSVARGIVFIIGLIGLLLKVLGAWYPFANSIAAWKLNRLQPALPAIGVALWAVSILCTARHDVLFALLLLAVAILVSGEIIHRIKFYNNYHPVGL